MPEMTPDLKGEMKPIPDPTTLTTEQLHRESDAIRREMERDAKLAEVRIHAVEQAMKLRLWVGYVGAISILSLVLLVLDRLK